MGMKLDGITDISLIELIADAHADAIKELYDRYHRLVFSVAFAILGDPATSEEVTLDVFVRVWQRAGTYRAERARVSTWLVAITRHHAIDVLRRQNSHPDLKNLHLDDVLLHNESPASDPEASAEVSLQQARVRDAVAQLPAEQRQALILAYFSGYTQQEIAEVLKQPLGTIKTRIRLAMQKLRQTLADENQPSDKSENT